MINKVKKSIATFLASFAAFGGLASAMSEPKANNSGFQETIQQQSFAPSITVVKEESKMAKVLLATKIAFISTGAAAVGYTGYHLGGFFKTLKKGSGEVLGTVNKHIDKTMSSISEGLQKLFDSLPDDVAKKLLEKIYQFMDEGKISLKNLNRILSDFNTENVNDITSEIAELISNLSAAIEDDFTHADTRGNSLLLTLVRAKT